MASKNGKLELTWVGKDQRPRLEPRLLLEDPSKSYGDPKSPNMLIRGDNLLALKALEQEFGGEVKCIFIDPPYNTGSAFEHYDDGIEHSIWLSLLRNRLEVLHRLLKPDGSIWITIDDNEGHYLKVLCDEVFGRGNFLGTVTWEKTTSVHNNATYFSSATDMLLVYARDISCFKMGRVERSERNEQDYSNPDNDERGAWSSSPLHVSLTSGQRGKQFATTGTSSGLFAIISPHGKEIWPPKGRCWGYSKESLAEFETKKLIWWGKDGRNQPRLKRFLRENKEGVVPTTLWLAKEVGHNQEAKAENAKTLEQSAQLFATPKPERLLRRVIQLATEKGDLVLDSFGGSGTTASVAHKMQRRWVIVEMGEHSDTHILPRMRRVVDGKDFGGVTEATNWKGGGGFKYYELAESLLIQDAAIDVFYVNPKYNADLLIRAICKVENFRYRPRGRWHGYSSESHFIHVVTQILNQPYLDMLAADLGEHDALLVFCMKRDSGLVLPPNVKVKRIPKDLLAKCEFRPDLK